MSESRFLGSLYGNGSGFAGAVWDENAVGPTLTTMQGGGREPMITEIRKIGNCVGKGTSQSGSVYDKSGISPTLVSGMSHGNVMPMVIDQQIVAMRGRDPENPSDRTAGNPNLEQRLEPNSEGISNTITTVQKDNYVLVKQATTDGTIPCEIGGVADLNYPNSATRRGRVQGNGQISPTLTTENIPSVLEPWIWEIDGVTYLIRIRKLTPKECWRLMDFKDEDFSKAETVNSNTQLYKQAGNSIVKNVLCEVFSAMLKGEG